MDTTQLMGQPSDPTNTSMPFDLQTRQDEINRRRMLASMLMQKALTPQQGQMVSGHYVAPSTVATLASLLGGVAGTNVEQNLAGQQQQLGQDYQSRLGEALSNYLTTKNGTPAQTMTDQQAQDLMENNIDPKLADAIPADPQKAALNAIGSGFSPLEKLGWNDVSNFGKGGLTTKDYLTLSDMDPQSRIAAALGGGVSSLAPKSDVHVVNNQLVTGNPTKGFSAVGDYGDKYSPIKVVGTDEDGKPILAQVNTRSGENKYTPGGGVSVNVNTAETAGNKFASALASKRADAIATSYDNAVAASKALDAMKSARDDLAAGIHSGASAQVALGLSKWAKSLGLPADPAIANTEAFRANMARETLQLVKNLGSGSGISDADRDFAEKASGGSIMLDDKAMYRLMNVASAAAGNVLVQHDRLLSSNANATGALPQDLATFKVPFSVEGNDQLYFDPRQRKFMVKAPQGPQPILPRTAPAGAAKPAPGTISVYDWLSK